MIKRMLYKLVLCLFFTSILFIQCEENKQENYPVLDYIRYGTSFGECLGYCYRQIEITESKFTFVANGWDQSGSLPEITCSKCITSGEWDALNSKIDLGQFNALPETIGCPDCADGGAEWIEIRRDSISHKVTFEYGSAPQEVTSYISLLRNYMPSDTNCELDNNNF